jgi:hypothetical protein
MTTAKADFGLHQTIGREEVFVLTVKIINSKQGKLGFHQTVYSKYLATTVMKEGMTTESWTVIGGEQQTEPKTQVEMSAEESACREFLIFLYFFLSYNGMFAATKTNIDNNILTGE